MQTTPFRFHIDPSHGTPIYRQIVDQVRAQIAGGRLREGEYLPSVRRVAETVDVNPMTISRAYGLLEQEGLVDRIRGKGMRVCAVAQVDGVPERQRQLLPLLEEAIRRADELQLTAEQVLEVLRPLLSELDHD